ASATFTSADTLTWTPSTGVTGTNVAAFTATAYDGTVDSTSCAVSIHVRPFGTVFTLAGLWTSNAGGLDQIQQTGGTLSYENTSLGLVANLINGTSFTFSNGQAWKKLDLSPTYTSSLGGNTQVLPNLTVSQSGPSTLSFVDNGGLSFTGHFSTPIQITVDTSS